MKETACDECGASIVVCDNQTALDTPAVAYDEIKAPWTIMRLGRLCYASVGDPSPNGRGHSLHEHQPAGSVMAG